MYPLSRALAALMLAGAMTTVASAQTEWNMPTPYPAGNFQTRNVIQFAADVEKATSGSLKIEVHAAGSLFKHPEIKSAVRQGSAPIGEILESIASSEGVIALPRSPVHDVLGAADVTINWRWTTVRTHAKRIAIGAV